MALRLLRSILTFASVIVFVLVAPVAPVRAAGVALPALDTFAHHLMNGKAAELRGVYVPDVFADRVVQQPAGDPGFVSPAQDTVTLFGSASRLGSTGLLAHNYKAGARFSLLGTGQPIILVYGDGHTATYVVTQILRYQALQPNSAFSSFVDLRNGHQVGAADLFSSIYSRSGAVILQTCIEAEGISTWGRLFVIAEPSPSADVQTDS